MRPDGGVRLKLDEEPRAVVIPLAPRAATRKASMVQKSPRPAIEASELALLAITLLLMSLFAPSMVVATSGVPRTSTA